MIPIRLALESKALLGEGPLWDDRRERLLWVDILGQEVHLLDPCTGKDIAIPVGSDVGAVVACKSSSRLLLAKRDGFAFLNPDNAEIEPIADPEEHLPGNRFNDGKCDPYGRFWAGTMGDEGHKKNGSLYCLDKNKEVKKIFSGVGCSNGMAWDVRAKKMYYIDTSTKNVDSFDYHSESGQVSHRKTIIHFNEDEGWPDGMTIDEEGNLWVAQWGKAQISCWSPHTGLRLHEAPLPAPHVSSCTFGGEDLNQIYVTSARTGLSEQQLEQYPLSGSLFVFDAEVKGLPSYRYCD